MACLLHMFVHVNKEYSRFLVERTNAPLAKVHVHVIFKCNNAFLQTVHQVRKRVSLVQVHVRVIVEHKNAYL
jgi:hypothetical protein